MIDPKGLLFGILGRSPVNFLVRENFSYDRFWNRILSLGRAKWQILSWGKVCVPKIGSAELLFQVKPQILSLGWAKRQILSLGKVCVPKIGSAELLFQVKPQILSLGGVKWQILSWRRSSAAGGQWAGKTQEGVFVKNQTKKPPVFYVNVHDSNFLPGT